MCVNITFVSQVCKTPLALCKRCMSNSMRTSENCGSHLAWSSLTQSDLMSSENRRILRVSKIITTSSEVCWIKKTLNTNLRQTKVSALLVVIHHVKTLLCPSHLTFKQVGHLILLDSKTQISKKFKVFFSKPRLEQLEFFSEYLWASPQEPRLCSFHEVNLETWTNFVWNVMNFGGKVLEKKAAKTAWNHEALPSAERIQIQTWVLIAVVTEGHAVFTWNV